MAVIGVAGRIGSGKSEVSKYFVQRFNAQRLGFSDILQDILERLYPPPERQNFQKLGKALRDAFGNDIVARAMREDIARLEDEIIVVDGVRYASEAEMIKSLENSSLVAVKASPGVRYRRALTRGEKGEEGKSYQEFLEKEEAETERHLGEVERMADYTVVNEEGREELYAQLEMIARELFRKRSR